MALVAASCLFLAAMVHAAITDARRLRVLNWSVLALIGAYVPLAVAAGLEPVTIVSSIVAAVLVFVIGFSAFCAGWLDSGVVTLAAVTTLWIGAGLVLAFLVLAALFAGAVTLLAVGFHRWQKGVAPKSREIAYCPGIVLAALTLFANSQWFAPV